MQRFCVNFTISYLGMVLLVVAVSLAADAFLQLDIGAAASILPVLLTAMMAGQFYAHRTGENPSSSFAWRAALWMTLIGLALQVVFLLMFLVLMPGGFPFSTGDAGTALILAVLVIFGGLFLLSSRYFFTFGAKQIAKQLDKDGQNRF